MYVEQDHKFDEFGSLASPCLRCNVPFTYAHDHHGWIGVGCHVIPYSTSELQQMTDNYLRLFPYRWSE